jgi:hypothetical protein
MIGSVVISNAGNIRFRDVLYFSFVTGLTIGYGDIVMKNAFVRSVALFLGFIGILAWVHSPLLGMTYAL